MRIQVCMTVLLLLMPLFLGAQHDMGSVKGIVTEESEAGESIPLVGANVHWLGTDVGVSTSEDGIFELPRVEQTDQLVVSYVGYQADTLNAGGKNYVEVTLNATVSLDDVEIVYRRKSTEISLTEPIKVETISESELLKAACCNLSESFETNPSVDVSFSDAITGTRQIQMLGLSGPYTQITRELIPDVRGLSALYGLTYTPGAWVKSMQLSKGTGSVLNGFESIAGQINVELRKPEDPEHLYANLYASEEGRLEANAVISQQLKGTNWRTATLLHAKDNSFRHDKNKDGFLDQPLGRSFIGMHRWKYISPEGMRFQFGIKGTYIDNQAGQTDFDPAEDALTTHRWGMELNTRRLEGWIKMGKVFEDQPWKSMAIQLSAVRHSQDSYFGLHDYDAGQSSLYTNFIYQSIINNTNHSFRTGASFQYDNYDEMLNGSLFDRTEVVPGAYLEYTYTRPDNFTLVAGFRTDYHNHFGAFMTPRLHLRYAPVENTVLRASAGRGQRTANILSENNGLLASSRQIVILGDDSDKPYGLDPEVAWNFGFNLTQSFRLDYRDGSVSLDFYRTDFENQIVIDLDQNPQQVVFYNLEGKSYSNSLQVQLDYELIKRLDARLAYRWFDVRTNYNGELMQKPLVAAHRAFLNLAYQTRNYWKFDYTLNWQGDKRIPFTASNPEPYRLPERSPDFVLMNVQISKTWRERFEVYLGAENLLNYTQENPILSSEQPFSPYFDSSMVWGPIFGRNVYVGARYKMY